MTTPRNKYSPTFKAQLVQELLKIAIAEAIGKTEEELHSPTNRNQIKLRDQQVINEGAPLTYEEQLKDSILLRRKFPIFNGVQLVYAIGGISTEITTQKQVEAKLEKALQQEKEVNEL